MVEDNSDKQSFWEHLDELRTAIVKSLLAAVVFGVAAFCFKDALFAVILAPKNDDFVTYRVLNRISGLVTTDGDIDFHVQLISTGLAEQFMIHMKAAMCAGVLCASPYILYQLFCFVSPALYVNKRRYVVHMVAAVITPTSDVFTLTLVAMPMWLLYETSIFIVKNTCSRRA